MWVTLKGGDTGREDGSLIAASGLTDMSSFIQTLGGWLLAVFRRDEVELLPPLERSRTKPAPQRPHYRRTKTVLRALDSAPPGATYSQLLAHVREQTGVSCSSKVIARWKKERSSSS
jgi:hypothetical protein